MRIHGTAQHEQSASRTMGPPLRGATSSGLRARSTAYALFSELTRSPAQDLSVYPIRNKS